MALPLPKVISDVGPGGGVVTAMRGMNALTADQLANQINRVKAQFAPEMTEADLRHKNLQNEWYAPNMRSTIDYKNAITGMMPLNMKMKLAQFEQLQKTNPLNAQILEQRAKQLQQMNEMYPQYRQAQIEREKALARNTGLGGRGGVQNVAINEVENEVRRQNPTWDDVKVRQAADAYRSGEDMLPSGEKLPDVTSGLQQKIQAAAGKIAGQPLQQIAANTQTLYNEFKQIPVDDLIKYRGPDGLKELAKWTAVDKAGGEVPESYRKYQAYTNSGQYLNMDTLRNTLKTSVIPEYVQKTLGAASNPASSLWASKGQVKANYDATLKWIAEKNKIANKQARLGALATTKEDKKAGVTEADLSLAPLINRDGINYVPFVDDKGKKLLIPEENSSKFMTAHPNFKRLGAQSNG